MNRLVKLVLFLLLSVVSHFSVASTLSEIRIMWQSQLYQQVINALLSFRQDIFGKNVEVDYMLATSFCRNPGDEQLGQAYLQHILQRYPLSDENRASIIAEKSNCSAAITPLQLAFMAGRGTAGGGSGVRGKMFYWIGGENRAIGGDPLQAVKEIPDSELKARLFRLQEMQQAGDAMQQRLGSKGKVYYGHHFIIGSLSDHTDNELATINQLLDKSLDFLQQSYTVQLPEYILSAYLVPDAYTLGKQGEKLHGLNVAQGTIGYSFQNDLSVSAVVKGPHVGTLKHELTHLLIRTNFGDAPPWLDEGLASLYEVSRQEGSFLRGLPNWRGEVLKRFWRGRPSIIELMGMSWDEFDVENGAMEKQATHHALARYWLLYLQEKDQLIPIYQSIRNRDVSMVDKTSNPDVELVESTLGMSLAEIESDFRRWLSIRTTPLSSQDIMAIQSRLNALGYSAGKVDGYMGAKTIEAIKKFQIDNGFQPDGELDTTMIGVLQSKTGR